MKIQLGHQVICDYKGCGKELHVNTNVVKNWQGTSGHWCDEHMTGKAPKAEVAPAAK